LQMPEKRPEKRLARPSTSAGRNRPSTSVTQAWRLLA
jgi:hypothetical protein